MNATYRPDTLALTGLLLVASFAASAAAETGEDPYREPDPLGLESELRTGLDGREGDLVDRIAGLSAVRLSTKQHLSGALGILLYRQPSEYDCTTYCDFKGPLVQVEPGLAGARISAGFAKLVGEMSRNRFFLSDVYLGFGVRGTLMRTWNESDSPHETLVGLEGDFTVAGFQFSLGILRRISGGREGSDPWSLNAGLGWGF